MNALKEDEKDEIKEICKQILAFIQGDSNNNSKEQSLNRSRNNINLAEENYKKAAEVMSQNIERLKIIKDKISKSNETNEKKE